MGWPQKPTPIQVDNTNAVGIVINNIIPKQIKVWTSPIVATMSHQLKAISTLLGNWKMKFI